MFSCIPAFANMLKCMHSNLLTCMQTEVPSGGDHTTGSDGEGGGASEVGFSVGDCIGPRRIPMCRCRLPLVKLGHMCVGDVRLKGESRVLRGEVEANGLKNG
jgi:hypothetical protein